MSDTTRLVITMDKQTEAIKTQTKVIEGIKNESQAMNNQSKKLTWATYVLAISTFILAVVTGVQIYSALTAQETSLDHEPEVQQQRQIIPSQIH